MVRGPSALGGEVQSCANIGICCALRKEVQSCANLAHVLRIGKEYMLRKSCALRKGVQSCALERESCANHVHILRINKTQSELAQILRIHCATCEKYNKPIQQY